MESEEYFKQSASLMDIYKSANSYIQEFLSTHVDNILTHVDSIILRFYEVYFNHHGMTNLRQDLLESFAKFLLKIKQVRLLNLVLAYYEFKESLMGELDDSVVIRFNLLTEFDKNILALSIESTDGSVRQGINKILVNRDSGEFFDYAFEANVLTITLRDSCLKLKPICDLHKYNRITKSNLICLETYIKDHILLTKRATSKFKNTFDLVKKYLLVNLNPEYEATVLPFGSITQFSQNVGSDLEITVLTGSEELRVWNDILSLLKQNSNFNNIRDWVTKRTRIINFYCKLYDVTIELMLNNYLGVFNSELIRNYCTLDARVALLINIIKDWSKIHKINGNKNKYLSSYCYTLMVIYFLQKDVKILPVLQKNTSFDSLSLQDNNGNGCHFLIERTFPIEHRKEDSFTLAELTYRFFYFYTFLFNEMDYCIDISLEDVIFRNNDVKYLNYFYEQTAYCIIDPYDYTYNPGGYMKKKGDNFRTFKEEMESVLEKVTNIHGCKNIFKRKKSHDD
jgi:hypothetical protein